MRKAISTASVSPNHFKPNIFTSLLKQFFSVSIPNPRNNTVLLQTRSFHGQFKQPQEYLLHLLQACSRVQSLDETKSLHALSITMGSIMDQPIYLNNNVMSRYVSLGEFSVARNLFDEMPNRNVVSYNAMISCYSRNGNVEEAWELFSEMRDCGLSPTQFTFGGLLSCDFLDLHRGYELMALIVKNGLLCADAFSGTALLGLMGRHGRVDEAVRVFEEMPKKSLVTWNSMITLFGVHGLVEESVSLFRELVRGEAALSDSSFVSVLSNFVSEQDLKTGEQIHGLVIKMSLDHEVSVINTLINMYAKCFCLSSAEKMFEEAPVRDVVSWNTVIGALAKTEKPGKVLGIFLKMPMDKVLPNPTTFVSVIISCAKMQIQKYGEFVHAKLIKNNFESDVFVGSVLVDFYAKRDKLEDAYRCFTEISQKNVVSWNALISGYSHVSSSTSVSLLQQMLRSGCQPNEFSFSSVLKSSLALELQQLHCLVIRMGYDQNDYVLSSLITSYAQIGLISDALAFVKVFKAPVPVIPSNIIAGIYNRTGRYDKTQDLFAVLEEPDLVSWNILLASCARNGDYKEVFELFKHMRMAEIYPDNYTIVSLLSVCANLCNLALGSSIHGLIIKTDFKCYDTFACNVLIDMYGKCGSVENAEKIFSEMTDRNLISWTALISALGVHGNALTALEKFQEMELQGFKPDGVAFTVGLSACRHRGLVKEGMELFDKMKSRFGIEPDMDHYNSVVDLLARSGYLKEAEVLIANMPFPPNALIWRSFLEGCKRQRAADDKRL